MTNRSLAKLASHSSLFFTGQVLSLLFILSPWSQSIKAVSPHVLIDCNYMSEIEIVTFITIVKLNTNFFYS